MASSAAGIGLLQSSSSQPLGSDPSSSQGKAKGSATPTAEPLTRSRIVRPRIDIDDQNSEANRVHDLLRKMSQAAKSLKKSQKKAKQHLIKKAARLNPADLERIAVLKRIFGDPADETAVACSISSGTQPSSIACSKGALDMHGTLRDMMKGVSGAKDVVMGLDANLRQSQNSSGALPEEHVSGSCSTPGPSCSALSAVICRDDRAVPQHGIASEQDDDIPSEHVRDESLDHGE